MTASRFSRFQWDAVGVGANSVDYVYRLPAPPEVQGPRAKMRIDEHVVSFGGQMTTALATMASLGLRGKYVGVTGDDHAGGLMRGELLRRGLDVGHVITRPCPNPFAVILVDNVSGERIVLWERDDALALRPDEIPAEVIAAARVLHVDDTDQPAAIAAARVGRAAGIHVTSDIDRLTDLTGELIAAVTIPMFAEHVPPALTGEADLERALRKLRRGHDGLLCATMGPHGSMLLVGDDLYVEPAHHVETVDTTGAGDVFRGAFIDALLRGDAPREILRFANAAAAVSVTRRGAMSSVPSRDDVDALLTRSRVAG
jgi:sugar/nucleoside kinase (ribokinase family)